MSTPPDFDRIALGIRENHCSHVGQTHPDDLHCPACVIDSMKKEIAKALRDAYEQGRKDEREAKQITPEQLVRQAREFFGVKKP